MSYMGPTTPTTCEVDRVLRYLAENQGAGWIDVDLAHQLVKYVPINRPDKGKCNDYPTRNN